MYLVKTTNGDKIVESANEVKDINRNEVIEVFELIKMEYDSIISTSDIRDCIYSYLKNDQKSKEDVLGYVSKKLDAKKSEISKVITAMKKEKTIYVVEFDGYLGIN